MLTDWFIVGGAVTMVLAFAAGLVRRAPLSTSIIYLGVGYLIGPRFFGLLDVDPRSHARGIEWLTAVVIVISIFSSALKLRIPVLDRRWFDPLRLAFPTMLLTIAGATAAAHFILHLPPETAFLLAAVLAPTDPVLASDVQVERTYEYHRMRFALTGEAGMNDGTALPMVTLALAFLGATPRVSAVHWIFLNLVWGVLGALLIGGLLGHLAGRYMLHLRLVHKEKAGGDRFLALGIMGLAYGLAEAAQAIGFVAVFAAGVAVRQIERRMQGKPPDVIELQVTGTAGEQEVAVDENKAPAFMLLRMRSFTENLERMGEAAVVVLLGSFLRGSMFGAATFIFAALLFFAIRPLSVIAGFAGAGMRRAETAMVSWFGIRGMASVYYLAYMRMHGASASLVQTLANIIVGVIVCSIVVHGASVTPFMRWFESREPVEAATELERP